MNVQSSSRYVVAGTGHRPDKIVRGGHSAYTEQVRTRLQALARACLQRELQSLHQNYPDAELQVITGGALGWDTALALAALELQLHLTVIVPFDGQEIRWNEPDRELYHSINARAQEVLVLYPAPYAPFKMYGRNRLMVDKAGKVLALWNEQPEQHSGTCQTIEYAQFKKKPVLNLWHSWVKFSGVAVPIRTTAGRQLELV